MIKFDPSNPIAPAMDVTTKEEADNYFVDYRNYVMQQNNCSESEAENIVKHNIGYFTGYCSDKVSKRVESLFNVKHPMLGSTEERRKLSAAEIIQKGFDYAQERKQKG